MNKIENYSFTIKKIINKALAFLGKNEILRFISKADFFSLKINIY